MLTVVAELGIEEDDQHFHQLRVVDQMGGPQTLLPQLAQFQPADTPERLEKFLARLAAYPAYMAANVEHPPRGPRQRPHRAAHRRRADDRPARAAARDPDRARRSSRRWSSVASDADRERVRDAVREHVYPADQAFLDALQGDYLAATPGGSRALVRARTARPSTGPRSGHGRRSTSTRRRSTTSASRSSARSRPSGGRSPSGRASATTPGPTAPRSRPTRRTSRPAARRWSSGRPRTSSAPWRSRRRYFGRLPRAGCDVRPVEEFKETRRAVRLLLPADRRRIAPRASTTSTPTTCRRGRTPSSRPRPTTRRSPGHHFQIALEMENPNLNTFRRLGSRMVGGAYVEGWGLYSERLADEMGLFRSEAERFGMLDAMAWRAARLVVDTGLHALRWTAPAVDRLPARYGPHRDGRDDRDRPLHLLARPGADVQDRASARSSGCDARSRLATASRSTCAPSTTPCSATARCRSRR